MRKFHSTEISHIVRYGKHCLIYEVFLRGRKHNYQDLEAFLIPESQERATNSYIIVNEKYNLEGAEKFLLEPKLKNYRYRIWLNVVSHKDLTAFSFSYFCFYCNDGKRGVISTGKIYHEAVDLQNEKELFPDVTINLNGHTLRITAPPAPPLVLITPSKTDSKKYEIHGQQENIVYDIAGKYNFTCHFYPVPGGSTGSKLPNGTWNGVMGEILYEKADIGLTVATAYERRNIADFTVSVFYAFLVVSKILLF